MITPTKEDVDYVAKKVSSRHKDGLPGWFKKVGKGSEEDAKEALEAILVVWEAGRQDRSNSCQLPTTKVCGLVRKLKPSYAT